MYFPYLRGKTFEILAVRELGSSLDDRIIPVFEPTTDPSESYARTRNAFRRLAEESKRFSVIVNSDSGEPPPPTSELVDIVHEIEADLPNILMPAFEIRPGQPVSQIASFSREFASQRCIIVHRNHTLSDSAVENALDSLSHPAVHIFLEGSIPVNVIDGISAAGKVLLRDGFKRRVPNASYPPRSNFGDLLFTYESRGYDGLSDFSIIGDYYSAGGGPAKHVAIHLTEDEGNTIVANHFVSTTPPQKGDDAAKYFSALKRLVSYVGEPLNANFDTRGMQCYYDSYVNAHYPGLGKLKQWSLMHHMEIFGRRLKAMNARSFI